MRQNKLDSFERADDEVRRLDFGGGTANDTDMYRAYQERNAFGLARDMSIHRIMPQAFYDKDVADGRLTLPIARADTWGVALENPLAPVTERDAEIGATVHLGSTVGNFHALCWTKRAAPTEADWANFSHGQPAVRISTTVGKLLDRVMQRSDFAYMTRHWLIEVEYRATYLIQAMQNPAEVKERMESSGALLALTVATVETRFSDEDEVRYLFDHGVLSKWAAVTYDGTGQVPLVRIPFDWTGFVEKEVRRP